MVNEVQSYGARKKEGSYIVLLHDHVGKDDHLKWLSSIPNTLAGVTHDYNSRFFHGFTGEFDATALNALRDSNDVKSISENTITSLRNVEQ